MLQTRIGRHAYVGTGVIVRERNGSLDVLTADHVVAHPGHLVVIFHDGTLQDARIVRQSANDDLAVIRTSVPANESTHVATVGANDLSSGQRFVVMGHPGDRNWAATPGIAERHIYTTLLFCPQCERGDSGAGAFDMNGTLRGIVTKKLTIFSTALKRGETIVAFSTVRPDRIRAILR